jgi:hypothetical protein
VLNSESLQVKSPSNQEPRKSEKSEGKWLAKPRTSEANRKPNETLRPGHHVNNFEALGAAAESQGYSKNIDLICPREFRSMGAYSGGIYVLLRLRCARIELTVRTRNLGPLAEY